jgi:hypothetical protein
MNTSRSHAERGNAVPDAKELVPTLRVGMPSSTLRVVFIER